ncbi:YceI family protein [Flavobacterium zepuense]|uniref:YceI family protein n=1 Tax=Flavobacterium zepuense TaxID=2593302 RepID=A0A552V9K5_9FLAO|nr:YceI family protein [Flavobacterium zepuense]TRW27148.1 YceI family protein [Flavobacterium zepuense]
MKLLDDTLQNVTEIVSEEETIWRNDQDHSHLGFTVTHMLINDITGRFNTFNIDIKTSKPDFSDASIEFSALVDSIDTQVRQRDEHLRSADFFDGEKYPFIHFKSLIIGEVSAHHYKVIGQLTIHGITRTVTIDLHYRGTKINPHTQNLTAGFQVLAEIKRSDYGVGRILPFQQLMDEVVIKADGEFVIV